MTKEDLVGALSLSCVENYFLAFFNDKTDIRLLYVESFAPFNKVIKDFCVDNATYENYTLARVQETAEKIEITEHKLTQNIQMQENTLTLIRVNEKFFENSKLTPWRADHYISIEKTDNGISYLNNYPLSSGVMTSDKFNQIYDNACLNYSLTACFNSSQYNVLANLQFNSIAHDDVKSVCINERDVTPLRNAILTLKTTRKRLEKWLEYMSERNEFLMDTNFKDFMGSLIQSYNKTFVTIELQLARRKIDINVLQERLDNLVELENRFVREVKFRRIQNERF